jgi:hypothetical protein
MGLFVVQAAINRSNRIVSFVFIGICFWLKKCLINQGTNKFMTENFQSQIFYAGDSNGGGSEFIVPAFELWFMDAFLNHRLPHFS